MTLLLRAAAVTIAVAGLLDPAVAIRRRQPVVVDVHLPPASDPSYAAALALKDRLDVDLRGVADIGSPEPPQAAVVIGNGALPDRVGLPVFVLRIEQPAPKIVSVRAPAVSVPGQLIPIEIALRGDRLEGRTSTVHLQEHAMTVDRTEHRWSSEAESATVGLTYLAPRAGLHRLRIIVETSGGSDRSVADAAVVVVDRPVRVLAYEPRPSWALTFVRRSLEADAAFSIDSVSRTSKGVVAVGGEAPSSLSAVDLDRYDVVLVGAVDELFDADLTVLDRFASQRGGQVVLLPDRRVPDRVRTRLALPAMEERLFERATAVTAGELKVEGSELLVGQRDPRVDVIGSTASGEGEQPVLVSVDRGNGRIAVSGLLDAWRFRAGDEGAFDRFWRGLVGDLGVQAPPKMSVRVEPAVARPGDELRVTATWRASELVRREGRIDVPEVRASIVSSNGTLEFVRLWPGIRPGVYEATVPAPVPGQYLVSVSGGEMTADAPLFVDADVVQPSPDRSAAAAFTARATGGAVVADPARLRELLEKIEEVPKEESVHPMRSVWWIVPFAALLSGEWLLRRRRGLQ